MKKVLEPSSGVDHLKLYKHIFDLSPVAIVVLDRLGVIIEVNGRLYDWLGYSIKEVIGTSIKDLPFVDSQAKKKLLQHFQLRLEGKRVGSYECPFLSKDGQIRIGRIRGSILKGKQDNVLGSLVIIEDVTQEVKKKEKSEQREMILQAIRFSSQHFLKVQNWQENLVNVLGHIGENVQADRVILFINNLLGQYFEWKNPEIASSVLVFDKYVRSKKLNHWITLLQKEQDIFGKVEDFEPQIQAILQEAQIQSLAILPIFLNNKWWGYLSLHNCTKAKDWSKSDVRLLSTLTDIIASAVQNTNSTLELRKTVEFLNREKQKVLQEVQNTRKFEQAVEGATDGVVITNVQGKITYVNKAWERLNGYTIDEVTGKNPSILNKGKTPKAVYKEMWKHLAAQKPFITDQIVNTTKDGRDISIRLSVFPIIEKNETLFYVGLQEDITRRKEVDQMKTEFISIASHQLNTPLSAMKWFLDLLEQGKAGELSEKQKEFLRNITESNQRMIALVRSLLNVSRIESGRIIVDPVPTQILEYLEQTLGELKPQMAVKNQKLKLELDEKLPIIRIDRRMMRHVFLNLLSNASKYSPNGSTISISVRKNKEYLEFSVKDHGYGIPKDDQQKLFSKFFRASNVLKLEADGSGLGLYLVKIIVESSGGSIGVKSQVNKGTEFWFTLPIHGVKPKKGEVFLDKAT